VEEREGERGIERAPFPCSMHFEERSIRGIRPTTRPRPGVYAGTDGIFDVNLLLRGREGMRGYGWGRYGVKNGGL
jgi:hypothetical protein